MMEDYLRALELEDLLRELYEYTKDYEDRTAGFLQSRGIDPFPPEAADLGKRIRKALRIEEP